MQIETYLKSTSFRREEPTIKGGADARSFELDLNDFPDLTKLLGSSRLPQEKMALGVAANFLAGGLATGGEDELDGMESIHNLQTWQWVLSKFPSIPEFQSEMGKLKAGIDTMLQQSRTEKSLSNKFSKEGFLGLVADYVKNTRDLKIDESIQIEGGWGNIGGGGGHALIYEITRKSSDKFDFHVYTSTGFQLTDTKIQGDKRRLIPVVSWEGIDEDHLFASDEDGANSVFFQQLFEMSFAVSKYDKRGTLEQEDILNCLDWLSPYLIKDNAQQHGFYTGQRGGTCEPSSIKMWARSTLGSSINYKLFRVYFDFRPL